MLREGLDSDISTEFGGDLQVAVIKAGHVLKAWREQVSAAVEEGNDKSEYENSVLPTAKNESQEIALKLVELKQVSLDLIATHQVTPPTKAEKEFDHIRDIVQTSRQGGDPLSLEYFEPIDTECNSESESSLENSNSESDSNVSEVCRVHGTAVKFNVDGWMIVLANGKTFTVTETQLLDRSKFKIKRPETVLSAKEKERIAAKSAQERQQERRKKEIDLEKKARQLRTDEDHQDFHMFKKMMRSDVSFDWDFFEKFLERK